MPHSRHPLPDGVHHLWNQLQRQPGSNQQHRTEVRVQISWILFQWGSINTNTFVIFLHLMEGKVEIFTLLKKIFFTKAQLYTHSFTGACCPTGVKLYRRTNNTLRVYWRSLGPQIYNHTVELYGTGANYTCMAAAGSMYCDIQEETCGDVYTVVAAPVEKYGSKVTFCQPRTYSGGNKIQGAHLLWFLNLYNESILTAAFTLFIYP